MVIRFLIVLIFSFSPVAAMSDGHPSDLIVVPVDPSILQPSPSCILDPCLCGWCPEKPDDHSNGLSIVPVDPNILQPSPSCMLDPCLCGWCPEESGAQIGIDPLSSVAENLVYEAQPQTVISRSDIEILQGAIPKTLTSCPLQHIRPWGTVRENYFFREEQHACTQAVLDLIDLEDQLYLSVTANGLLNLSGNEQEAAEAGYRRYVSICLQSLTSTTAEVSAPESSRVLRNATAPGQVEHLFDSVGRLSAGVNGHTCSAVIASTSRGPALLTASHCLGLVGTDSNDENLKELTVYENLEFTSFSGNRMLFDVDLELDGFSYDLRNEDVAGAFISSEATGLEETFGLPLLGSPLEAWEPLLIVGENPYLSAVNRLDGLSGREHLEQSFVVSLEPSCQYRGADHGSISYFCQTARGMSGSPILVIRNGRFYVAGVHNRRTSPMAPLSCENGALQGGANAGIAVLEHNFE